MAERDIKMEKGKTHVKLERSLRFLTPRQIKLIDEMLDNVTPFGEVTLRVQKRKVELYRKI